MKYSFFSVYIEHLKFIISIWVGGGIYRTFYFLKKHSKLYDAYLKNKNRITIWKNIYTKTEVMQSILFHGKSYTNKLKLYYLNSEKGLKCALKSKIYRDMGKENKFTIVQKKIQTQY